MAKEIHVTSNLKKNLVFPFYVKKEKFTAGQYKMGDLVELGEDGAVKKITAPENIYGVVTDDFEATSSNTHFTVYLTGAFNQSEVNFNSQDQAKTVAAARKLLIMID